MCIEEKLTAVRKRIKKAALSNERNLSDIELVAVSKRFGPEFIIRALNHGQKIFGENYVQEGVKKIETVTNYLTNIRSSILPEWHFIGPLQSNKAKLVASHFDWVHTVDRMKIVEKLSIARENAKDPLNVCIQINTSGEKTKHGVSLSEAPSLVSNICDLPKIKLRGFMTLPSPNTTEDSLRKEYRQLLALKNKLNTDGYFLDTLSMGMSRDLEIAISEGSTIVRVGTAVFGERI